ncbi:hypothetical protein NKJ73_23655 [Mesorhizobium sp. M0074]|uniref:hypothetical protein n=1 Tax=unclassified Mesorhizobium TaxID=325217 RepID=UPI000FD39349|nr:hypothetical protein [Mesorhizobium sp.]RUU46471.1 hypothetical protein EOD08_08205 [Mesorhizobium sp. M6A.T.Ca.TU.002.02.2.1]RWO97195.1 MAG: hypothetical protein EOQ98_19380 [Mesorhizobium sp.]TIM52588.1 MAG: hypothetical protein E5Y69_00770 [Mesorhizobium sp.]
MDITPLMPWLVAISTILSLGTTVFTLVTSGAKKTATDLSTHKKETGERYAELEKTLDGHGARIQSIESEMKHLPDATAFMDLRLAVSEIKGDAGKQAEVVNGIARTVHRMENFLLSGSKSE